MGPQVLIFLVINDPLGNLYFETMGPKELKAEMMPVFPWGSKLEPQPDLNWPIDDMDV